MVVKWDLLKIKYVLQKSFVSNLEQWPCYVYVFINKTILGNILFQYVFNFIHCFNFIKILIFGQPNKQIIIVTNWYTKNVAFIIVDFISF